MRRVNEGLTQTSGSSGSRGSVMVNDISVAITARSRSRASRRWSPSSVPDNCWNTTIARACGPSNAALEARVNPVTQSRRPSPACRWAGLSDEPRRAASCTATGSPATGTPRATSESGDVVSLIRWPPRSVRPAASLHTSTSTGSPTRSPVNAIAAAFA